MNEALSQKAMQPQREKYWEECDDAQKIERLRDALARACADLNTLSSAVQRLAAHRHGETGDLLIPIHFVDPAANYPTVAGSLSGAAYGRHSGIPYQLQREYERR